MLIVEDDVNFAAVLAEEAHAHGFSSVHCRSGLQALNLLQSEHFSAVILDILLPDISGWQLFRRLRGQASHRNTPVHIISCVPQPVDWNDDGTRYLVKPIQRADLEQVFVDCNSLTSPQRSACCWSKMSRLSVNITVSICSSWALMCWPARALMRRSRPTPAACSTHW